MSSIYHGDETLKIKTKFEQEKEKPVSLSEGKTGVDLRDRLLQPYLSERKKF
jgi:hypothetical protein